MASATLASIAGGEVNQNAVQGLTISAASSALRKILNTSEGSKVQSRLEASGLFKGVDSQYASTLIEGVKAGDSVSLEKSFARLNDALIKGNINQTQYVELLNIAASSFKGLNIETNSVSKSSSELIASFNALKKSAGDLADKLLLSDLSTLNPMSRITESKRQYDNVVTKALRGEFVDSAKLDEVVNNYLTAGQQGFTEYSDYTNLFSNVIGDLRNLQNMPDKQDTQTQAITQSISELKEMLKIIGEKEVLTSIDIKNTLDRIQKDGLPPYVA